MTAVSTARHRLGRILLGGFLLAVLALGASLEANGVGGLDPASALRDDEADDGLASGEFLAGHVAVARGELEAAHVHFERALARNPGNRDLLGQVFMLALARGEFSTALDHAEAVLEAGVGAEEARLLVALTAAGRGDFETARAGFGKLPDTGLAGLVVPLMDAWAIFGAEGPAAVEEARKRLDEGESLGALNRYHEAMLLLLAGRNQAAIDQLAAEIPTDGPAPMRMIRAYAAALAADGQIAEAEAALRAQLEDGREQAVVEAALEKLGAGEPLPPPFQDAAGGMADALLGIAQALQQERSALQAILYARLATYVRPDLAEASFLIGDVLAAEENYPEAITAYEEVPADSPLARDAGLRIAQALHVEGRHDEAYARLEQLAEAEPDRIDALVQLGDLLRREEAYLRAEDAYSRAVARIGEPQPEHWTLFYARGITYERTKRWTEAEEDFLLALELEPEQPFVLNYLGYSWVDMGRHLDRAKGMLERAVELRPRDGFIVDSLGWVHYRLGEYEKAVEALERAVELEPGDPVVNDHLGDAYWRVGREREARYQWERALTLEPEEDEIPKIERKLERGLPDETGEPI